jgi:hypothetical protein
LLAEELEASLLADDALSELVVGVLEEDSVPVEELEVPVVDDSVLELPDAAARSLAAFCAAALLAVSLLAAAAFAAALFSEAVIVEPAAVGVVALVALVFVERAGSCPEASCT